MQCYTEVRQNKENEWEAAAAAITMVKHIIITLPSIIQIVISNYTTETENT